MKKLIRLFASPAGFLNPRQIHSTKTGRASERTCPKSLIINDQILHPPPKSPGNIPSLSEVIRSFALKAVLQEWKARTVTSALTDRCNSHSTSLESLHRGALCCSVLHRVARKIFSHLRCNTFTFPTEPGRCMVVLRECARDIVCGSLKLDRGACVGSIRFIALGVVRFDVFS